MNSIALVTMASSMLATVLLSQVAPVEVNWQTLLVAYGPMAIMLFWFAWRAERKIDALSGNVSYLGHKLDGLTRAMLADVAGRDNNTPSARKYAQDTLEQMERDATNAPFMKRSVRTPFVLSRDRQE